MYYVFMSYACVHLAWACLYPPLSVGVLCCKCVESHKKGPAQSAGQVITDKHPWPTMKCETVNAPNTKTLEHGCHGMGVGWIGFGTLAGLLLVKFQMLSCSHQYVTFVTFGAAYFSTYDHMAPTWIVSIATWEVLRKTASALSASSVYGH